jgi:hypothetical protein
MKTLTMAEVKILAKKANVCIKPSYVGRNYVLTSMSITHKDKAKLIRLTKLFGINKSAVMRLLINSIKA